MIYTTEQCPAFPDLHVIYTTEDPVEFRHIDNLVQSL